MKYTDRVVNHPMFAALMEKIKIAEADRIYCGHRLEHGMDVARLAWIYYLEDQLAHPVQTEGMEEVKDLFYCCALLHDIGRVAQYETGVHHSIAGVEIAEQIIADTGMPAEWERQILEVVSEHSDGVYCEGCRNLSYFILKADHDCRLCFACEAKDSCKWSDEEMNHRIES